MKATYEDFYATRQEFLRVLPVLVDGEGEPLTEDIMVNDALDAVGFFHTKDIEGNTITIRYFWGREN